MKIEKKRLSVADSRCRQNVKFGDFTSLLRKGPQKYFGKIRAIRAAGLSSVL